MQDADYAPEVLARFWAKVEIADPDGCWVWQASRRNGYGQFGVRVGYVPPAHRYAYEYLVGPIPDGLVIDHLCRNPPCVNPTHMEPVTSTENVMRGMSPRAVNARRTHCVDGHGFTAENTYIDNRGRRHCKACRRRRQSEFRTRNPGYQAEYGRRRRSANGKRSGQKNA